jgi:hypothetical protein
VIGDITKQLKVGKVQWFTQSGAPLAPLQARIDAAVHRMQTLFD